MALGQPGLVLTDEPPQLLMAADLAGGGRRRPPRPATHSRPRGCHRCSGRWSLGHRIGMTGGASLHTRQFRSTGEFRKPRHLNLHSPCAANPCGITLSASAVRICCDLRRFPTLTRTIRPKWLQALCPLTREGARLQDMSLPTELPIVQAPMAGGPSTLRTYRRGGEGGRLRVRGCPGYLWPTGSSRPLRLRGP